MPISEIIRNDLWSVAEGEHNNKALYIRFRGALRSKPNVDAFPCLIRVVWSYESDENGLPTVDAIDELTVFEARLTEAVQPAEIAVLVAAITNDGQREWMFYASTVSAFERRLNDVQADSEPYPMEVSTEQDPDWTAFYQEIMDSVGS